MEVEADGGAFVGAVMKSGALVCRIMVTGPQDVVAARTALAGKARRWIADYLVRNPVR